MARATTSAASASETSASTSARSFAHGLIAYTSVGLKAVAVAKENDR